MYNYIPQKVYTLFIPFIPFIPYIYIFFSLFYRLVWMLKYSVLLLGDIWGGKICARSSGYMFFCFFFLFQRLSVLEISLFFCHFTYILKYFQYLMSVKKCKIIDHKKVFTSIFNIFSFYTWYIFICKSFIYLFFLIRKLEHVCRKRMIRSDTSPSIGRWA